MATKFRSTWKSMAATTIRSMRVSLASMY
jgi:hypothetical protein